MKIIALLVTAILNSVIGVVVFFFLLLGMNGFSERQATPGLILFIVWMVITLIITGVLSFLTTKYLINKKSLNAIVSGLIGVAVFVAVGAVSGIVGCFAALFLVSALR